MHQFKQDAWPALDKPYRQALHEAVEHIFERFEPVGALVSGTIIRGNPSVAGLRSKAADVLAAGPEISSAVLTVRRYTTATWFEDAIDIAESDPELCVAFLFHAVDEATRLRFWEAGQWEPRPKDLLRSLAELDPELTELALAFHHAGDLEDRIERAGRSWSRVSARRDSLSGNQRLSLSDGKDACCCASDRDECNSS